MDFIEKTNEPIVNIPEEQMITNLVKLSLNLYQLFLEAEKKEQFCLLITDFNDEEIIHLCYRADVSYFSYFESLRDELITNCQKRGISIALNKMSHGNELLPYGDVNISNYVTVFSEERTKLSLKVCQIERLELHPTIQRKGIFTKIVKGLLAIEPTQSVIVTNIYNFDWLTQLKKSATETTRLPSSRAALFDSSSNL